MKRFYLLFCAVMAVAMLSAQSVKEFPKLPDFKKSAEGKSGQMRAPINVEKEKGTMCYATTWYDATKRPSFVKIYTEKPTELERIHPINPEDEHSIYRLVSGAYNGSDYYGYTMAIYGNAQWEIPYCDHFVKVDWETGTYEELADMSHYNADFTNKWEQADALTADPKTGKLYAAIRSVRETALAGRAVSAIVEVDITDGTYKEEGRTGLQDYFFSIAYDRDGVLWGLRWDYDHSLAEPTPNSAVLVTLDPEDDYRETLVAKLTAGGKDIVATYPSVITFDYTTGDLYCLLSDVDANTQYLAQIDFETGAVTEKGRIEQGFSLCTGIYIPYKEAESRKAPAAVTDMSFTYDADGANKVTLKWKNPTTAWDRTPLTSVDKVFIYRDEIADANLVTEYAVTNGLGGAEEYTDDKATQGKHTYYFVPSNAQGKGIAAEWDAFVGHDVPDAPTGLFIEVSADKNSVTIDWKAPNLQNHGANGGWFDKASLKYDVRRYPDDKLVAENITDRKFTDADIEVMQSYYYEVIAKTNDGTGNSAQTERVIAGSSIRPPFSGNFLDEDFSSMWKIVDANDDGTTFVYQDLEPGTGLKISTKEGSPNNDYAISPEFLMKENTAYRIMFDVYSARGDDPQVERLAEFAITVGREQTAEGQTEKLEEWKDYPCKRNTIENFKAIYRAKETGIHYAAYHFTSKNLDNFMALKNFTIEEIYEKDLKALSIDGTKVGGVDYESEYTVEVENYGDTDIESYKVETFRYDINGNVKVLGTTDVNKKIVFGQKNKVTVNTKFDNYGIIDLFARVVVDGDKCEDNDIIGPWTVEVARGGVKPIDKVASSGVASDIEDDSTTPVSFLNELSRTQTIYTAKDFKTDANEITIERIGYKYRGAQAVENLEVQIYLGNVDQADFGSLDDEPAFISNASLTKVYDGPASDLAVGENLMWSFDLKVPFVYETSKNLIVEVVKKGGCENPFPAFFSNFNWKHASSGENIARTLLQTGTGKIGDKYWLPELYYAGTIGSGSAVEGVVADSQILWYSNNEKRIVFSADVNSIAVYDIAGRMMMAQTVAEGQTSVSVSLPQGIYVVKAVAADNSVSAVKINVMK